MAVRRGTFAAELTTRWMPRKAASTGPVLLRRLLRAKDRIDAASHEQWPIRRLADVSGVSEAHFARAFRDAFGIPPHRYLLTRRKINALGDWRGAMLVRLRMLIKDADPDVVEEMKWRKASNPLGVPTWSHAGIICTGESYRDKVKLTFASGASLPDPTGLFNSSLTGGTRRGIDIPHDAVIDEKAFKALVNAAVAHNVRPKN
jgi:hypothetical protein